MKKVISFFAVAAVFAFTGTIMASPPVCPPFEGFLVETETDIVVHGRASDAESFDWKWNDDACDVIVNQMIFIVPNNGINDPDTLGFLENVGRITYEEEFDSFNGLAQTIDATTYHKKFTANSHPDDTANLVVEKDIGYTSDGEAGSHADLTEIASEEVVSAGEVFGGGSMFTGVLSLCPWAFTSGLGIYPTTNEGIAMGSTFAIPAQLANGDPGNIDFSSDTEVGVTNGVYMIYDVDANGKGLIQAEMIARLWEGSDIILPDHLVDGTPPLNSVAKYQETAVANGIFTFHKGMLYRATFEPPEPTPIGLEILAP